MIRIAIAGTHGVGKTTLAHSLADSFEGLSVVVNTKIARTLIDRGYPLGKDATSESYIQYIISQLNAEINSNDCNIFISDRTLLDPLAYAEVNKKMLHSTVPDSIIELLASIWLIEAEKYDLYVFVPVEFEMQPDGIRPNGEDYRKAVEAQMLMQLEENRIEYITVSGTVDNRKKQIIEHLNIALQ